MLRQGKAREEMRGTMPRAARAATENLQPNHQLTREKPAGWTAVAGGLFLMLAFLVQGLAFLKSNSQTSDEAVHLAAGYSYLSRGDFRLNPEHPPLVKELCAFSVLLAYRIPFRPDERLWTAAEEWRIGR